MPGFDRSKLKSTGTAMLKEQDAVQEALRPSFGNRDRLPFFSKFELGDNVFRIFPYHPEGDGETFSEAKTVSFLEVPREVYKDGEPTGDIEYKRAPVFNAKVHGVDAEGKPLQYDLVETYIDLLYHELHDMHQDDEEAFKKDWNKATGFNDTAIKPQDKRVMYANKLTGDQWEFGFLEVGKMIVDGINKLAYDTDGADTDPFTDPDTGIPIVIVKSEKQQKNRTKTEYTVGFYEKKKAKPGGGFSVEIDPVPLTDADVDKLIAANPLSDIYRGVYTETTFREQLEGLQRFDNAHGFGVTQMDDFLEAAGYLADNVQPDPEPSEEADNGQEPETEAAAPAPESPKEAIEVVKYSGVTKGVAAVDTQETEVEDDVVVVTKEETEVDEKPAAPKRSLDDIKARFGKK